MSASLSTAARYGLAAEPGLPPAAEAASLLLGVLRAARATTWSDLLTSDVDAVVIPWEVSLTDRQIHLLDEHQHLLRMLRRSTPQTKDKGTGEVTAAGTKMVTLAVCPECQRWILMSSGPAPAHCAMTVGCAGKPVKASAASKDVAPEQGEPGAVPDVADRPEAEPTEGEIVPSDFEESQ